MESPLTRRANVRALGLIPMVERSTAIHPGSTSSLRVGRPATTSPQTGMGVKKSVCTRQVYNRIRRGHKCKYKDPAMPGGETPNHSALKALALAWAREQGMSLAAPEVSFPHRKFRVDVAACAPTRKVPSRSSSQSITSVLKAAAVFECKQVRSDLIRDNKRRDILTNRLKELEARRTKLEALLHLHLPHLANGECLLPEYDSYRLSEY